MNIVYMAKSAWTGLLDTIRSKAGVTGSMTVSQAADAVESITGSDGQFDELVARTIVNAEGQASAVGDYAFFSCPAIATVSFPNASFVGATAFRYCSNLTTANFQTAEVIGSSAFASCHALNNISFPSAVNISAYAFDDCAGLTYADFPKVKTINGTVFRGCHSLHTVSLPAVESIGGYAFLNCWNLLSLYLLGSSVPTLSSLTAFNSTPISNYTASTGGVYGSIFVPASLYDQYISATNWSRFSSRFVSV